MVEQTSFLLRNGYCLSISLSVCLSVCLSACLSFFQSVYLSVCLSVLAHQRNQTPAGKHAVWKACGFTDFFGISVQLSAHFKRLSGPSYSGFKTKIFFLLLCNSSPQTGTNVTYSHEEGLNSIYMLTTYCWKSLSLSLSCYGVMQVPGVGGRWGSC